jgi:hypothetical protein
MMSINKAQFYQRLASIKKIAAIKEPKYLEKALEAWMQSNLDFNQSKRHNLMQWNGLEWYGQEKWQEPLPDYRFPNFHKFSEKILHVNRICELRARTRQT